MSPELKYHLLSTQFEEKLLSEFQIGHNRGIIYLARIILDEITYGLKNIPELIIELNEHISDCKSELHKLGVEDDE